MPILVLLAWALLYLPRPFLLGFYHDDWWTLVEPTQGTAPFSPDRLKYFVGIHTAYASRPVLGLFGFLASSVVGSSAMAFQVVASILVLIAALSLRSWLNSLLAAWPQYRSVAADWASIAWMAMPWMVAVTAWPTMSHALLAQIFFTEAARVVFFPGPMTMRSGLRMTLLLIASGLTYETFYFQIFPIIALYALSSFRDDQKKRKVLVLFALSCLAQVIPILLNRYIAQVNPGTSKKFDAQWPSLFATNIQILPIVLKASLREHGHFWAESLRLFVVLAVCLLGVGVVRKANRSFARQLLLIVILGVVSCVVSTFVYSLAGYGFSYTGVESRALFGASWSFAVVLFALLACALIQSSIVLRSALAVSAVALVVVMAQAQRTAVDEWAYVWQQERSILAAAPLVVISRIPHSAAILYIGPSYYKSIVIFGASWDLTAAVFAQKTLREARSAYQDLTNIYPATEIYKWSWDGSYLIQDNPGSWTQKFAATQLYVWDYKTSRIGEVGPGFRWPP